MDSFFCFWPEYGTSRLVKRKKKNRKKRREKTKTNPTTKLKIFVIISSHITLRVS